MQSNAETPDRTAGNPDRPVRQPYTELQQSQSALQESEQRFRAIFDHAADGIGLLDADGRYLQVNRKLCGILGYAEDELVGKTFQEITHPDDLAESVNQREQLKAGAINALSFENRYLRKDGSIIWVDVSSALVRGPTGAPQYSISSISDISARKQAEHAQQQSEAQLSGIVESAMHAIIMVDEDMNIILFNPAAEEIFGYQRADMAGVKLDRLIPARFRHTHGKHINAFGASTTAARKMSERGIIKGLRANGEEFPAEASISHLTLNGKKLYTVILADITARLAAEENLRLAAEVIKNSPEGIVITDASNRIISVNPAFTSITGFTAEEVIGEHPRILSSGVQDQEFYRTMWAAINASGRWQGEIWDRRKSGELYCEWLSISTVKNPQGEIVYHTAIFSDITERKRAEQARANLAAIVENSNGAIFSRSLDGAILSWNAGAERLLGYTAAEAIGKPATFNLPPGRQPNIARNNERVLRGEAVAPHESKRMTKDGRVIDVLTSHSPLKDNAGNIVGASIILQDISALKQAEAAVKESEERFRAAFEQAGVGMALRDIDPRKPRWLRVNQKLCDILGYTREELLQLSSVDIIPPEERQVTLDNLERLRRGEISSFAREKRYMRKDGQIIWTNISVSTVSGPDGRPSHMISVIEDISVRKRAEAERAQLATIVEFSQDAIIGRTLDGTITSWNAGAEQVYGYTSGEAIGRNVIMLIPPERRDHFESNQKLLRDGEARPPYESINLAKDGRRIPLSVSIFPIYDAESKVTGCAAIIRDITERKRAEQEIFKLNAGLEQRVAERTHQLEAVNKELEAFSYSVSHDLRAPLRGIDGFSQMLLKKYGDKLDETGNDYLQRVRRASVRMGELIDDLLQLSRVSRSRIKTEAVDLSRLARSILAELQEREPERKVVTEVQDGIEVSADPRLLKIALENLLGNAWKFTGKNSEAKIRFGAKRQDGELIVSVKDNGAGFNTKYAHKLFGAFQRLHSAAEFEGTGIGLATVQRIIHLHGGRVWADAAMDKGATFYFAIPRATRNNVTITPQGEAA